MIHERRWNGWSWLALAAVAALWLATIGSSYGALLQPTDGWLAPPSEFPPALRVFVGDWPTPLRTGDKIFAIGGVEQNSDFTTLNHPLAQPNGWAAGNSVPYTIKRGEQTLTLDVPIQRLSAAGVARAFAAAASDSPADWGYFLIAALVFALRPGSNAARLLFVFGGAYAAVTKISWAAPNLVFAPQPIFWVNYFTSVAWGYAILPPLLLLALSFPRQTWLIRRFPRRAPALIFGVSLLASAAAVVTTNGVLAVLLLLVLILGFVLSLIITSMLTLWRSRDPVERAQTGWVLLGIGLSIGLTQLYYLLTNLAPESLPMLQRVAPAWLRGIFTLAMPICLGIAITRYRLFDIDIIIRRTLVYSVLTLTLGLVYVGCILLSRALIAQFTGTSEPAIVVSTLVIAALFFPLRRRIQNTIDRRFYRRKYDAQQVLAQFALTARDETDLQRLTDELLRVVNTTVQPEFAGVWLREPGHAAASQTTTPPSRS